MSAKTINQQLDDLFQNSSKYVSYEKVAQVLGKLPTAAQAKRVSELAKKHKKRLMAASEVAKILNQDEARKIKEDKKRLLDEELEDEFDFMKERELLEWSRSDSPVRMYLREMGQIPLLTRDEEIELSKNIELGENIILDAICSVPYLIDFILDYKEALINRERRVKELFKSFDDDEEGKEFPPPAASNVPPVKYTLYPPSELASIPHSGDLPPKLSGSYVQRTWIMFPFSSLSTPVHLTK